MRGPFRIFIGDNEGSLRVVAAEGTKPSWKRDESAVQCG
jgi:hypothetical protein